MPRPQAGRLDTAAMAYRNAFPTDTLPDAWQPGSLPTVPVSAMPEATRKAWIAALRTEVLTQHP
jgi:hypothetical protein